MNLRERLLSVIKGRTPDKIPWFADLVYLYDSLKLRNRLDRRFEGDEGYLEFHKELGAGIYLYAPSLWKHGYGGGVEYSEVIKGNEKVSTFITPRGKITSEHEYLPISYSWACTRHYVETIEDLRVMLYVFENSEYCENYSDFNRINDLWGEHGLPAALAPISVSPIQKLLARWAGVENTMGLYMDHEDELGEVIERIKVSEDKIFEILEKSPADLIEFPENLSSEITGRNFFERYSMDYYRGRIQQLHGAGKLVSIHIDGTLKACLPLLQTAGFDIAEAVTPAPVGDIPIGELRSWAGEDIIIWGGLPGALFSPVYSEEIFDRVLEELLETFPRGSKFVLGVADQVPPDGLIHRVKKVRDAIEKG